MTDFVSIIAPPRPDQPPVGAPTDLLAADGFFPATSVSLAREVMAISTSITEARLREALYCAIATALIDLAAWGDSQRLLGFTELALVPSVQIDGQSGKVRAWHRAIFNLAKADLCATMPNYDATGSGARDSAAMALAIDQYRHQAQSAIRDIKGAARLSAALV